MVDKWIWRDAKSTVYTMKTAYNHLKGVVQCGNRDFLMEFWKVKSLPSAQVKARRVLPNIIATKDNLMRRGMVLVSNLCPLCDEEEETVNHLFF